MTIEEAVRAARMNQPVADVTSDGVIVYARIGAIRKTYALLSDVARGAEPESYSLELLPMNRANTCTDADPKNVRLATAEELMDREQYRYRGKMPEVHPELLCDEVRSGRPWADRKGG